MMDLYAICIYSNDIIHMLYGSTEELWNFFY